MPRAQMLVSRRRAWRRLAVLATFLAIVIAVYMRYFQAPTQPKPQASAENSQDAPGPTSGSGTAKTPERARAPRPSGPRVPSVRDSAQRRLLEKWPQPPDDQRPVVIDASAFSTHLKDDLIPLIRECRKLSTSSDAGRLQVAFELLADPDIGGIVESVEFPEGNEVVDEQILECIRESALSITFPSEAAGRNRVRLSLRR